MTALLIVGLVAVTLSGVALYNGVFDAAEQPAPEDPKPESTGTLDAYASLGPDGLLAPSVVPAGLDSDSVIATATQALDDAVMTAQQTVGGAVGLAHETVGRATSTYNGLAPVPYDHFPGLPIDVAVHVPDYNVQLDDVVGVPTLQIDAVWYAMPSDIPGRQQLVALPDEAQADPSAELQSLIDALQDTLGPLPADEVFALLEGTPIGPAPSADQDVEGAVDPHEDGAIAAFGHAERFLGTAGDLYGQLQFDAEAIVAQQTTLIDDTYGALDALDLSADLVNAAILAEALARVDAAQEDLAIAQGALPTMTAGYLAFLEETATGSVDQVDATLAFQVAEIEKVAAAQEAILSATAVALEADTDARVALIEDTTRALLDDLRADGASSSTLSELLNTSLEMIDDAVTTSNKQVDALHQARDDVSQRAEAAIRGLESTAAQVAPQIDTVVEDAVAETQDRLDYALERAEAVAAAEVEAHLALAEATRGDVLEMVAQQRARIIESAYLATNLVLDNADVGLGLVDIVQAEAVDEITLDLDYITSVIEDYSSVPIPDREARATYWAGVHDAVTIDLGATLGAGDLTGSLLVEANGLAAQNLAALDLMV